MIEINAVRYTEGHKEAAKLGFISKNYQGIVRYRDVHGTEYTKDELIHEIVCGEKVSVSGGEDLIVVEKQGTDYIKSKNNNSENDNLGNLPEF